MKIIIADQNNWEKSVEVQKAVVRIGSADTSDIPLSSASIAPVHLQLHYLPEEFGCKVLNLGSAVTVMRSEHEEALQSYARTDLQNGDEIVLGEYRIRVQLPITTKVIQASRSIGASLSFPNTTLYSHAPTVGWLTVENIGEQSPSQFHVDISGLPDECVKIDPIPLLYAGAQEEVRVQLFHRGMYPYAGLTALSIRVFAPGDYPGEQVLIEQGIYVAPVFEQSLEFANDLIDIEAAPALPVSAPEPTISAIPKNLPSTPPPPRETLSPVPLPSPEPIPTPIAVKKVEVKEVEPISTPKEAPQPEPVVQKAKPMPKPVIVRDLPDEFWDEGE